MHTHLKERLSTHCYPELHYFFVAESLAAIFSQCLEICIREISTL